jgi:hypothetical protein
VALTGSSRKKCWNTWNGGLTIGRPNMNVYEKLQEARIRLQNTALKKSGNNKFAGYQYFELGDFLPAIQTIFKDLGLCGVVRFTSDTASLEIVDTAQDGKSITFTSPMGSAALKGCHEVQNIGAVETYQRRYLWTAAMEIVEHDALDATTSNEPIKDKTSINAISKLAKHIETKFAAGEEYAAFEAWEARNMDAEESIAVWGLLGSKTRSTLKLMKQEADKPVAA